MFYLICVWINGWVNNREAGDLRRHLGHYDVSVMHYFSIVIHIWDASFLLFQIVINRTNVHGSRVIILFLAKHQTVIHKILRIPAQTLWRLYNCPRTSEVTLQDTGKLIKGILRETDNTMTTWQCWLYWMSSVQKIHHSEWRHNERDGASNYRRLNCLLNGLYTRRSKKTQSSMPLALVRGIFRWTVVYRHKWPVTRQRFSLYDLSNKTRTFSPGIVLARSKIWWYIIYNIDATKAVYWSNVKSQTPSITIHWRIAVFTEAFWR